MMDANFGNVREYSVSELAGAVKRVIEDGFAFVRVKGELGRVTRAASGHLYVDLKDENASLSCVIWKGAAGRLRIAPEQGMEVVATGKMTTFPGQSRYQLVIDSLEPAGVGALMALLEERKKKLAAEGLFDVARKRVLPFLPDVIGVVTSPSGAVIRDILNRLRDRFPRHVIVWPTLVQGKGAEAKIAAAIEGFNALPDSGTIPRPDVLIVARGGGSLEDLWCFNEEIVVRAAAASRIPLISAVGHQTDTTLIDYASDYRAETPSAAAEKAVPMRSDLISRLATLEGRLINVAARAGEARATALRAAVRGLGRPEDVLGPRAQRFDRASDLLKSSMRARLDAARLRFQRASGFGRAMLAANFTQRAARLETAGTALRSGAGRLIDRRWRSVAAQRMASPALRKRAADLGLDAARLGRRLAEAGRRVLKPKEAALSSAAKLLQSLSHQSVLERGFALVRTPSGALIARASAADAGAKVRIIFADGARDATFDGAAPGGGARRGARSALQKSLFD